MLTISDMLVRWIITDDGIVVNIRRRYFRRLSPRDGDSWICNFDNRFSRLRRFCTQRNNKYNCTMYQHGKTSIFSDKISQHLPPIRVLTGTACEKSEQSFSPWQAWTETLYDVKLSNALNETWDTKGRIIVSDHMTFFFFFFLNMYTTLASWETFHRRLLR